MKRFGEGDMHKGRWFVPGLSFKLASALVFSVIVIAGGLGLTSTVFHERDLEHLLMETAERNADVVRRSARTAMLENDRVQLYRIMNNIATEPGIIRLRIYNEQGRITYSTDKGEIGRMVDKRAEACLACHTPGKVLARPQRTDRMRIFSAPSGGRVLAVIQPIANEPACSQAPCHYHPANQQVLGTIDLQMSLATIDAIFRTGIRRSLAGVLLLVLSVAAIAILFTLFLVDRPVRRLIEGTHQVAEGDLDHVIPIRSQDELGLLARSFNEMTRRLKEAMQVIRHYNETLEEKVEQKTQELKRAQERMLHVERMATVGRLAAIIAHEINNPLSGIRTYAKLLQKRLMRKSDMNEETGRYLDLIESESARCGNIVRDLLQFSRKSPMEFKPADISKLAREAVRLVQHRLDLQAIDVRMSLPEGLPEFRCSDQQVIQALLAILINACEAMPSDGTLKISTGGESSGVWVLVEDSGTGMDDETKRHIYEPFFTTKEEGHGVGLGLAVVFTIVSRHGGHIDVDSTPGKGTRFTLHFPLQPPVPEEGQGAEEAS